MCDSGHSYPGQSDKSIDDLLGLDAFRCDSCVAFLDSVCLQSSDETDLSGKTMYESIQSFRFPKNQQAAQTTGICHDKFKNVGDHFSNFESDYTSRANSTPRVKRINKMKQRARRRLIGNVSDAERAEIRREQACHIHILSKNLRPITTHPHSIKLLTMQKFCNTDILLSSEPTGTATLSRQITCLSHLIAPFSWK